MFGNTVITARALSDFIRHFGMSRLDSQGSHLEIKAKDMMLSVYNYDTAINLVFAGDGIVYASRNGVMHDFDHHAHDNRGEGAFWVWLNKNFPE